MGIFKTCKVIDLKDHPQATKLKLAIVSDGVKNFNIVCGAKNIRLNMITILAEIGSTTAQGLTIKESTIRGSISEGMLCSPLELGISQEQGIVDLPPKTSLGIELSKIDNKYLSSTPWWQYKLVEQFYCDMKSKTIKNILISDENKKYPIGMDLISETYWHEGQYLHRHFLK